MFKTKIIILSILLNCSCIRTNKSFDEIHLFSQTDSSYIQLIISKDSIIILQLEFDRFATLKHHSDHNYYAQISKPQQTFSIIDNEIERILADTFQCEMILSTHSSFSELKILFRDSLVKYFRYYDLGLRCKDLYEIERKLLVLCDQSDKYNLNTTIKLIDVSDLNCIDSIRIYKLKPHVINNSAKKNIVYLDDSVIKNIKIKSQIASFTNCIRNLKILDSLEREVYGKFIPTYRFEFFRNKLIHFELETDLKIMPYSWLQILKVDSCILNQINSINK